MAVWRRENYEFEKEEDFLKVCFGFARHIQHAKHRDQAKRAGNELHDPLEPAIRGVRRLEQTEMTLLLEEIRSIAKTELSADELAVITASVNGDASIVLGRDRVTLYRARKKLAKLTGWRT